MLLHLLDTPENVKYFSECMYKYNQVTGLTHSAAWRQCGMTFIHFNILHFFPHHRIYMNIYRSDYSK